MLRHIKSSLYLMVVSVLISTQPSSGWGAEWIKYQDNSISTKYYYSDIRGHSQIYLPYLTEPQLNISKTKNYSEKHDSITLDILTEFKDYQTDIKGKYRYNSSITRYVISCSNYKLWEFISTHHQVTLPILLLPNQEGIGKSWPDHLEMTPENMALFMLGFPPLAIDHFRINNDGALENLAKRFCKDFYPNGPRIISQGQKPKKPKKFTDLIGLPIKSDRAFTFYWDHAIIEMNGQSVLRYLWHGKDDFWYVTKYQDNHGDYAADDAFKIINGQLHHWRWNWQNENFDKVSTEKISNYDRSMRNISPNFQSWSKISFSSETGITFSFKRINDECITSGNMFKDKNTKCKFTNKGFQVGPFIHISNGNSVTWNLEFNGTGFNARVSGQDNVFARLKPTYRYKKFQPPFTDSIADLFTKTNIVMEDKTPLITFDNVSGQCVAKSRFIKGGQANCSIKNKKIILQPFNHASNQDNDAKIEWMFKRNHLGGMEAFVRTSLTSKWPDGWEGFGDFSLAPK